MIEHALPLVEQAVVKAELEASGSELLRCSFCSKTQRQVKKLIAGPSAYICDECLAVCNDIIGEHLEPGANLETGADREPEQGAGVRCPRCGRSFTSPAPVVSVPSQAGPLRAVACAHCGAVLGMLP